MTPFDTFIQRAKNLFPFLSATQEEQFRALETLYSEWNSRINVISRKDIGGLYPHHVMHSLAIADYLSRKHPDEWSLWRSGGVKALDLGTGGGFPGIPLAILCPESSFVLCDSIRKKCLVTEEVVAAIGLSNVKVVCSRAENLSDWPFDYVVSRAVTDLENFYPWVKGQFTRRILYLKGGDVGEELSRTIRSHKLNPAKISVSSLDGLMDDSYFDTKLLIDISL